MSKKICPDLIVSDTVSEIFSIPDFVKGSYFSPFIQNFFQGVLSYNRANISIIHEEVSQFVHFIRKGNYFFLRLNDHNPISGQPETTDFYYHL